MALTPPDCNIRCALDARMHDPMTGLGRVSVRHFEWAPGRAGGPKPSQNDRNLAENRELANSLAFPGFPGET